MVENFGKNFFAGVDLGGTKILTVIADEKRSILSKVKIPTQAAEGAEVVFNNIFKSLEISCKEARIKIDELRGVGVGVPGPVNHKKGLVYNCPNLIGWKNIEVKKILEKRCGVPVVVENDARTAGLAEARSGAAKGFKEVFYVTIGTGIGGAIIIDGKIYRGAAGGAGEFGQMRLLDGTIFEESYAGPAIERLFGIGATRLPELIAEGDCGAQRALAHLVDGISVVLADAATLLNPEIIVVGGGVSLLGDLFISPLREKIRSLAFSVSGDVKVVPAALGGDSGAIGGVELLFA